MKIKNYSKDTNVVANDKWIGSDFNNQGQTKNFTPTSIAEYYNHNQVIDSTSLKFTYQTLSPGEQRYDGTISFVSEIGPSVAFSSIYTFLLSKKSLKDVDVSNYIGFLNGGKVILSRGENIDDFGFYKITDIIDYIADTNFFVVSLDYIAGHGSMVEDKDYFISLVSDSYTLGEIPTKTSDLTNDGEDGVHPFVTLEDLPTLSSTFHQVTTNGNETTNSVIFREDANKFVTINSATGSIEFWDLTQSEDYPLTVWNKDQVSVLGTLNGDYVGANTNISINPGGLIKQNLYGGYNTFVDNTLFKSLQIKAPTSITGDWIQTYQNASGTIALLSNIPSLTGYATENWVDFNYYPLLSNPSEYLTLSTLPTTGRLPIGGVAGQILTKVDSTDYNATWQDNYADWTSVVKHTVKNDGTSLITKGTPVYVTSSNGTNMLVGKASNTSEATSSKTMGLMQSDITTTGGTQTGFVVTEGLLGGLNTSGTTEGDPVWLGPTGTLLYGLINKPYAPAHLVFIGIVTKVSSGNGEIFIKVQNGFELKEIHDIDLITTTPSNNEVLSYDSATSLWKNKSIIEDSITDGVTDKAPSQNSVFDALDLKQNASLSAYTVIANNTNASANGVSQTFKSIANQTYTGTPVWTGTTAPSGVTTHSYSWNQIGNLVTLRINLVYATGGSALTAVTIPLPTDCPAPYVASGGTPSTNRVIAVGSGIMQTNFAVSTVTTYVVLKTNSTNTGFDIIAQRASANYQMATVTVTYLTN